MEFDNIVDKIELHKSYNGILLTDSQVNILMNYGFDVNKYSNIKELIFDLDNYLNEETDIEELEIILNDLSEFDYYHNTNK